VKMIVLEGPDLAGKSTLASRLNEAIPGSRIVHFGPPKQGEDLMRTYLSAILDAVTNPGVTIFDRLHVGAYTYGKVMRQREDLDPSELDAVDVILDRYGSERLFVTAPWGTILERMKGREEDFVNEEQLRQVWHLYEDILTDGGRPPGLFGALCGQTEPAPSLTGWRRVDVVADTERLCLELGH
jgi:thymidylate kinase